MNLALSFFAGGCLLLLIGLVATTIRRVPLTTAMIYLCIGLLIGPTGFGFFHFNPMAHAEVLEFVTEIVVLISLFTAGMKMPTPLSYERWRAPLRLAFLGMSLTVGLMSLFGHYALGMPWGAAVLLAAILAPTDPVLATDVQVRHAGDRERLRFGLTSEGGMNDGSAFPFVMLGLGLLGAHEFPGVGVWFLHDVVWATCAAIAIGLISGRSLASFAFYLRTRYGDRDLLDDFLGFGLIGTVYGLSLLADAWGFLAVFFAALALRQQEHTLINRARESPHLSSKPALARPRISDASLAFKEQLERLCEVILILLVGCTLFADSWSWRAVATAGFLFFIARPISVLICLQGVKMPGRIRGLTAWFGVRGIGTLYYLSFSVQHGVEPALALELIHISLIVVALSILVHGISIRPLMNRFGSPRRKTLPLLAPIVAAPAEGVVLPRG